MIISEFFYSFFLIFSDTNDYGCNGGITVYAYYYIYEAGGLETNQSYPYTSYYDVSGTCNSNSKDYVVSER
jgi:hypothetical protein